MIHHASTLKKSSPAGEPFCFFSLFPCFLGERTPKARQRKRIFPLKLWEYPLKINNL
jgi:hypothetical protein